MKFLLVCLVALAGQVQAQSDYPIREYPVRSVRIIVPSAPGGGTDIIGRVLAQHFSTAFGQPFVVDNKAGAGNMIGIEAAARSAPDGYTLLFAPSPLVLNSVLYRKVPYDPVRDFAPITLAATAPNVLLVGLAVPARTLRELIALARQKPGALNYASAGIGTLPHISMELFKSMTGTDLQHVPYKGTMPGVADLMGGEIAAMFANAITARPLVDAGRVRALAVSGPARTAAFPGVPTVAEAGVAGYEAMQWYGLLAPAGTPAPILARIHAEAIKALQTETLKEKLAAEGAEPVGSSPSEFAQLIRNELEKWTRVARSARIEPQ
jgi:tripartite-type tricarboxylate transporter receptor subunit TctC